MWWSRSPSAEAVKHGVDRQRYVLDGTQRSPTLQRGPPVQGSNASGVSLASLPDRAMRRHALTLSLAFLALAIGLGAAQATYRLEHLVRPSSFRATPPVDTQETRVHIVSLTPLRTSINVLVRQGTVRFDRDSLADSTLRTPVPITLALSPEATWMRVTTDPEDHAVELRFDGVTPKPYERPPWGRVVTLRKIDGRWQAVAMFLPADSIRSGAGRSR